MSVSCVNVTQRKEIIVNDCSYVCEIVNKPINNLNGVFSGVTRYNWWSELVEYPNIVQYFISLVMEIHKECTEITNI
jgi:hypothetical protein